MKDLTITEAVERLGTIVGDGRFDIDFSYIFKQHHCTGIEWTVTTFVGDCEQFSGPTLRGCVEQAEYDRFGPKSTEEELQSQLNVLDE